MLINRISGLLLLIQIFCISGVPHRFVEVEDNLPTFLRNSVEHVPTENERLGALRDAFEDEMQFSRSAVESIPQTKLSYFLPLRSAVEHNPLDEDEEAFDAFTSRPVSQKQKFLKIVTPKRFRKSKAVNFEAYVVPSQGDHKPHQYRAGSQYQQLVDPHAFNRKPQSQQMQQTNMRFVQDDSDLKVSKGAGHKVVCHITNWSFYRKNEGKFVPENLDSSLCTHIVYSFATLDPEALEMREFDPWGDIENQLYSRTVNLDRNVPVILGMGGWTDSSGNKYTRLVASAKNRMNFISRAISFLRQYGFSGAHIDWNYPSCPQSDCRAGSANDKDDFTKFIKEMSKAFSPYGLLLSISISGYKEIITRAYDLTALSSAVDFMTIMSYDYHGSWESVTGHVSPLYGDETDKYPQYNTDYALKLLEKLGADKTKMIVGIPFYGQTFMLSSTKPGQGFNSPADGPGMPGEMTNQPGMLAYSEICNRLRRPSWKKGKDASSKSGPYATDGSQWVGYDDVETVMLKTKYAANAGFGGIAAWTVDLDDFTNRCCLEPFPLLRAINRALGRLKTPTPNGNDCTKPPTPITPVPPLMVATVDTGAAGIPGQSTTYWSTQATTTSPWWVQSSTTTTATVKPTRPTNARPTKNPTQITTVTTSKPTRRTRTTSRTTAASHHVESTAVPVPVNVMPVVIQGDCSNGEHREHPQSCNQYLICLNGDLITLYCSAGLHWNDRNKNCDWPLSAQCSVKTTTTTPKPVRGESTSVVYRTSTEKPTTTRTPTKPQRPSTTQKPMTPITTTRYTTTRYTTSRYTTEVFTRPTTTIKTSRVPPTAYTTIPSTDIPTTYMMTTQTPTLPTKPTKKPVKGQPCVNGAYSRHKQCNKYYICNNGKRTPIQCPEGTQFSQHLGTCDHQENVKCVPKKKYLKLLQAQYMRTGIFNSALLRAAEGDPCDGFRYLSFPGACANYLECVHDQLIQRECPQGLYYDAASSNCNWPDQVECEENALLDSNDIDGDEDDEYYDEDEEVPAGHPDFELDEGNFNKPSTSTTTKRPSTPPKKPATSPMKPPASSTFMTIPVPEKVQPLRGNFKLVCYFTNWAWYRPGIGKYLPDNIDENLCTHVVYGFAVLSYDDLTIKPHDSWADLDNKFYDRVVALKQKGVKVTLAIGGWNDSEGDKYSRLVRNAAARKKFVNHVIGFLEKYNFDGLDLDWEYPVCWQVDCKKGHADEKENFAALVRELSEAFKPRGLLLSSAVSPSKTVIDAGYDVPTLAKYFDWIAVMCYDYHGQWDKKTGHVAPLMVHPEDEVNYFNTEYTMKYWIQLGAPASKLVMGMPLYGQSFTLADPKNNGLNAKAPGPGQAGEFTRAAGFLAYYEICDRILNKGWTVVQDPEGRMGPYAYSGNQWVSFDDQAILRKKTQFIKKLGLGGGMVWALDLDDFTNKCGQGKHPLLKIIHGELEKSRVSGDEPVEQPAHQPDGEDEVGEEPEDHDHHPQVPSKDPETPVASPDPEPIEPHDPIANGVDIDGNNEGDYEDYEDEDNEVGSNDVEDFKVVCYFTNWAWYRQGIGKFVPEDIDPELCTHIVYGFAVLDRDSLTIKPHDSWADIDNKFYGRVVEFKRKGVRVTVAIGGWNDSAGDKYSRLVRDASSRARFIKNVVEFIEKYGFEGLDLDWEYPVCWQVDCSKGMADEKEFFAQFVEELSREFKPRGLLLSTAVSPSKKVIDAGYDIPRLAKHFDWIAVMAYDYHGQWDKKTGHVAPMYEHSEDWEKTFNANFSMNYWIQQGANPRKLIMGMPMYGQSFSLAERNNNGLNSATYGGGEAGEETRARGFLAYYEICQNIRKKNWSVMRDLKGRMGPYAYSGDQWVSFDDAPMIRHKSEFVKALGLGGAMIWALDLDDFKNVCGCEEYPLLRTINRVLRKYPGPHNSCVLEARKAKPGAEPTTKKPATEATTKKTTTVPTTQKTTKTVMTTRRPTTTAMTTRITTMTRRPVQADPTRKPPTARPQKTTSTTQAPDEEYYDEEIPELEDESGCEDGRLFLPHKTDCNKYYQCDHGNLHEKRCPGGLHWNEDKCDWPNNSKCVTFDHGEEDDNDNDIDSVPSQKPPTSQKPASHRPTSERPESQRPSSQRPSSQRPSSQRPTTQRPTQRPTKTESTTKYRTTAVTTARPSRPPVEEKPVILTGNEKYMVVCYFTNWAWYRPGIGKYKPDDIDANLCTHIVYGFAVLNRETLTLRTHDSWADIDNNFYGKVADYQSKGIKVTLAIGGWNDSLGDKYSRLVRDPAARKRFINHAIEFLKKYNFQGLDLDWEYPVCWQVDCSKGKADEKEAFAAFVRELSEAFKPEGLLLSAAVSPSKKVIDAGYDIPTISKYFDWIAVMCYDYHGQWDKKTGHVAPLFEHTDDWERTFNANFTMHYWISKGAPRNKLVMGMPTYGQSFALEKTMNNGLNAIAPGPGQAGEFTRAAGFLAFYEICDRINRGGWTVVRDPEGRIGPYAYNDRQWVSYDDVEDIRRKTKFVKDLGIAGAMIWALDLDDFRNRCGCGSHPLLSTINLEFGRISTSRRSDCT